MTKAIADKAWIGIAGGITLFLSAIFVGQLVKAFVPHDTTDTIQTVTATIAILAPFFLLFTSAIAFVRGCCLYAKARGCSSWVGFAVGLLPFVVCLAGALFLYERRNAVPHGRPVSPSVWRQSDDSSNANR